MWKHTFMNLILIITLFFLTNTPSTTTYYFVRHAEKACEDCGSCGLSPEGNIRAIALANYLSDKGIDSVFASQCLRTISTAQPIAKRQGKKVTTYHTDNLNSFINSLSSITKKDVLIVGHSNQIPMMVKALSGKRVYMSDTDFDNIYVITKSDLSKKATLKKINYGVRTR